jgi:hypothetical protein
MRYGFAIVLLVLAAAGGWSREDRGPQHRIDSMAMGDARSRGGAWRVDGS